MGSALGWQLRGVFVAVIHPGVLVQCDNVFMAVSRARLAAALWIAWAVVVWNVVLDQTIVLAGRRYIVAAVAAAQRPQGPQGAAPYARIDDWMRPAVAHGFWLATVVAGAILAIGFFLLRAASRTAQPS